jgi:hypothetical protein
MMEQLKWAGTGETRSRQVRRLRRDSQSRSGRPRVSANKCTQFAQAQLLCRANYVGLPSMAGRGTGKGGESRRIMGEEALVQSPEVRSRGQKSPKAIKLAQIA